MSAIRSFRELTVYKAAFALQQSIYRATQSFPFDERFGLVSQIRNSSRSVGANIAEAWRKRRYPPHFISKLSDADAELAETRHWLDTGVACSYIDDRTHKSFCDDADEIGRMLGAMIAHPERWESKQ